MCGRYSISTSIEELIEFYGISYEGPEFSPYFNAAPGYDLPIILNEDPNLLQLLHWGIKPKWFKAKTGLINIRAETLREKNTFKKLFENKRCIIPSTGFYEWQKSSSGKKIPYHIKVKDEKIFSFAGVWDDVKDEKTGEIIRSFSIITTETNELLKDIHNRMPVILPKEYEEEWLNVDTPLSSAADLLIPYDSNTMEAYIISDKINRPTNNSAEIINPA